MKDALYFLYSHIKPYKWWYVLILQAPFISAIYIFANNYSLKLIIDAFSITPFSEKDIVFPVVLFLSAQVSLDLFWRISNFAEMKCEAFARRDIIMSVYTRVQNYQYTYFQNTQSGSIISKMKGILDGYDTVFNGLQYKIGKNLATIIFAFVGLFFVNKTIGLFMLIWIVLFFIFQYPMAKKLGDLSNIEGNEKHNIFGNLADNISNIFTIFSFATKDRELKANESIINRGFVKAQVNFYRYNIKFNIVGIIFYWPMLASTFLFMIYLKKNDLATSGDFMFIMSTIILISFELWSFISGLADFMKEMGDFKSSFSIMQISQNNIDKKDAMELAL